MFFGKIVYNPTALIFLFICGYFSSLFISANSTISLTTILSTRISVKFSLIFCFFTKAANY